MGILFNKFLEFRLPQRGAIIGGRQVWDGRSVQYPPAMQFSFTHTAQSNPNEGFIKIFNMAPSTQRDLLVEGDRIEIEAGYWPQDGDRQTGIIFSGQITDAETNYRRTYSVTKINVADSEDAYAHARTRQVVSGGGGAGPSHREIVDAALEPFRARGITIGRVEVPDYTEARPRTIDRLSRLELDDIAYQHDLVWHIQDGVFNMYPRSQPLETGRKILTPDSGVLGVPEFNAKGVTLKTQMIPSLRPGEIFELRNDHVQRRVNETLKISDITFSGSNKRGRFGAKIKTLFLNEGKVQRSRQQYIGMVT